MTRVCLLLIFILAGAANVRAQDAGEPFTGIRISSPDDNSKFKAPADIVVTIEGYDNPTKGHLIRLYEGDTVLYAVAIDPLAFAPVIPVHFQFDFDWNNAPPGHYVLTAMIDNVSSQPINVTVTRKHRRHR
jgi:hypothetical protein